MLDLRSQNALVTSRFLFSANRDLAVIIAQLVQFDACIYGKFRLEDRGAADQRKIFTNLQAR